MVILHSVKLTVKTDHYHSVRTRLSSESNIALTAADKSQAVEGSAIWAWVLPTESQWVSGHREGRCSGSYVGCHGGKLGGKRT